MNGTVRRDGILLEDASVFKKQRKQKTTETPQNHTTFHRIQKPLKDSNILFQPFTNGILFPMQ